jgi:RHS repeat-associated protein
MSIRSTHEKSIRQPRLIWLLWLLVLTLFRPLASRAQVNEGLVPDATELRVLREFYLATGGDSWSDRTNWPTSQAWPATATSADFGTWTGVGVTNGDVTSLYRNSVNLQGSLPASLGLLTGLTYLTLVNNPGLTGPLPENLGQLRQLYYLRFTRSPVTGPLPASLAQLTNLQYLYLDETLLSGTLPAWLGGFPMLQELHLVNSAFSGPIPPELGNLAQLRVLEMGNGAGIQSGQGNAFTGSIPPELGKLTQLQRLDLSLNPITGSLPPELGQLRNLYFLELDGCHLSGPVPAAIAQLPQLRTLLLGYPPYPAYQDHNAFTSLPAPSAWADLPHTSLRLEDNQLEFGSLEPYFRGRGQPIPSFFTYLPQTLPQDQRTVTAKLGRATTLPSAIGGSRTHYQWQRQVGGNWVNLSGASATAATYALSAVTMDDLGSYRCQATNEWVTDLTLYSRSYQLLITANDLPPDDPSENRELNWTLERSFDGDGHEVAASKQFVDGLGRATQAQARNAAIQQVFASQTVYNSGGQPVLQTLAAPINNQSFNYRKGFVTAGGQDYSPSNFEDNKASNPDVVDATDLGTLGYYFSKANAQEPLTPITSYPYSLVEPYEGPLGGTKRAAGPGDELRMGRGREAKGRDFPVRQEFDTYFTLKPQFVPTNSGKTLQYQAMKSVSVNADGRESIVVTNKEGQAIISCLSGPQYPGLPVSGYISSEATNRFDDQAPAYQDIHIPAAGPQDVKFTMSGEYPNGGRVLIVNLLTSDTTSYALHPPNYGAASERHVTLDPGFYRFVSVTGTQWSSYEAHYGSFSYTYYDDAGRVVAAVAPKGTAELFTVTPNPTTAIRIRANTGGALATSHGTFADDQYYAPDPGNTYATNEVIAYTPDQELYQHERYGSNGQFAYAVPVAIGTYTVILHFAELFWSEAGRRVFNVSLEKTLVLDKYDIVQRVGPRAATTETFTVRVVDGVLNIDFSSLMPGGADQPKVCAIEVLPITLGSSNTALHYVTQNTYDTSGRLLATENMDEGRSEYVYAQDGRIRFSQSALQRPAGRFSYSNYDEVGRVVESGEYQSVATTRQTMFCGQAQESQGVILYAPPGQKFVGIQSALYGAATGSDCLNLVFQAGCSANITANVQALLADQFRNNLTQLSIPADNNSLGTDPCYGTTKMLQVIALCQPMNPTPVASGLTVFENHLVETPADGSVLQPALLEDRTRSGGLDASRCTQRNQVWYDLPFDGTAGSLGTDSQLNGRAQEFVVGAVTKTQNENVTTWYSYDELGRVTWVVQDVKGVGVKTLEYKYDFSGNVLEVAYQKGQPDSFFHTYSYDAAQRLSTVSTSSDGTTQTLQAEYSYYLHGPLKRVQVAGDLQGVDYTYTLQGALKAINHVNQTLEPGHDAPTTNGVYKDLFALTLDYFSGDYRSKALDAPALTAGGPSAPTRYDGTIQGAAWRTAASTDLHRVAYTYDEKSQLQDANYAKWKLMSGAYALATPSTSTPLREGGLSYDANGNIQSLQRTDQTGAITDNFSYSYKPNTNQLQSVHTASAPATALAVLDYDYDELGQMTRQREGSDQRYFAYDVTGKTTGVYLDAAHLQPLVEYAYDDRGFRLRQTVYPATGGPAHVTTYVRDVAGNLLALYEQATPTSPAVRSEVPLYGSGRLGTLAHLADGTDDYRYELTDHLGNARVVFHRPTTTVQVETMELGGVSPQAAFLNDDRYRVPADNAPSGQYVARLTDTQAPGQELKRVLAVTRGDTITFSALGQWKPNAATGSGATPYVLAGAAAGVNALSQRGPDGQTVYGTSNPNWLSLLAAGLGFTLGQRAPASLGSTALEGWIKYRVLDAQGNLMLDAQGQEVKGVDYLLGTGKWEYLQTGVRVPQNGTLEVMAGTTGLGEAVYFDNLRVEQTGGLIVQEQHQYAYGAPLPGLSYTVGNRRYRYGYQGQYAEHDSLTGFDSFELRLYNSRIGRWMSYDPEGQYDSPYVGMGNNPVSGVDPTGGFSFGPIGRFFSRLIGGGSSGGVAATIELSDVAITGSRVSAPLVSGGLGLTASSLLGSAYTAARITAGAQRLPVPDPSVISPYQAEQINHKLNPQQYMAGGSHYNYLSEGLESVYPEHTLIPAFADFKAASLAVSLGEIGATMSEATIVGADEATAINARNLLPEDGVHQIVMHGDRYGDHFLEVGITVTTKVPAKSMAKSLLQSGYQRGTPIRLVVCHAGVHADGLAYQLSRYLKAPVTAATTEVGVLPGGEFFFIPSTGFWRTFYNTTITR